MNHDDDLVERLERGGEWRQFPSRISKDLRKQMPLSKHSRILFVGPPDSGKIPAAAVLVGDRALDIYQIDLSKVISKYIGETEKNLGRMIVSMAEGAPALLLFTSAEALAGVRLSTTDLLRKLERFPGPVIVAGDIPVPEKSAVPAAAGNGVTGVVVFGES